MLSKPASTALVSRKRGRATREQVKRLFALAADEFTGQGDHLNHSATYYVDHMGGALSAGAVRAHDSADRKPVFGSWHYPGDANAVNVDDRRAGNSVFVFNKLYGLTLDMTDRQSNEPVRLHAFSAFYPRSDRDHLTTDDWIFEPMYGGEFDRGESSPPPRFTPRPAVFDWASQTLMFKASSDFGWRALFYENSGRDDDKYPTGIVALEGFLFKAIEYMHTSKTGKQLRAERAEDEDDVHKYAARVQRMIDEAPATVVEFEAQRRRRQEKSAAAAATAPDMATDDDLHEEVRRQMDDNARADDDAEPRRAENDVDMMD